MNMFSKQPLDTVYYSQIDLGRLSQRKDLFKTALSHSTLLETYVHPSNAKKRVSQLEHVPLKLSGAWALGALTGVIAAGSNCIYVP